MWTAVDLVCDVVINVVSRLAVFLAVVWLRSSKLPFRFKAAGLTLALAAVIAAIALLGDGSNGASAPSPPAAAAKAGAGAEPKLQVGLNLICFLQAEHGSGMDSVSTGDDAGCQDSSLSLLSVTIEAPVTIVNIVK
jgi:hypothetical protein